MASKRKSIRQFVATAIGGVATRLRPTQENELPAKLVYTVSETGTHLTIGRTLERQLTLTVEIRVAALSSGDDLIDDLCEGVEAAIEADPRLGGHAVNSVLRSTVIGFDAEAQTPQIVASLEYLVTYVTP